MGKTDKGTRLLNEKELNDIHGGRAEVLEKTTAYCKADGCGWSSGCNSYTVVQQLMQAHFEETGHGNFLLN